MIYLNDRIEKNVEIGENAGLSAFSPFPTMYLKAFFFGVFKTWDSVVKS